MERHHEDDDDDDDDLLAALLSYECPVTGRKRVAGSYPVDTPTNKPKFLGRTAVKLCFIIGYLGIYITTLVPSKLRFNEIDLDESVFCLWDHQVLQCLHPLRRLVKDQMVKPMMTIFIGACAALMIATHPSVLNYCQHQPPLPKKPPIGLL